MPDGYRMRLLVIVVRIGDVDLVEPFHQRLGVYSGTGFQKQFRRFQIAVADGAS